MTAIQRGVLLSIATLSLVGCGDGQRARARDATWGDDATVDAASGGDSDVSGKDGSRDGDGGGTGAEGGSGGPSDTPFIDGGVDATDVRPPPMTGPGNIRLFTGAAGLLTHGNSCTSDSSASDRWCAFAAESTISLGNLDLFVVNVTRAAAGATISCNGLDPNCLRLTAGFYEESSAPFSHAAGFQGDTLIYFDLTWTPYAWRPGMPNGRVLAYDFQGNIQSCLASAKGTAVLCLRYLPESSTTKLERSELLVGRLDGPTDPPLRKIETVVSTDKTLGSGQQRFRYGFRPDGQYVGWSSAATVAGVEVLKTQQIDDDATRVTVATDVSRWGFSPDGSRWYWLSHFNYDSGAMRSGTLQTAPFADGTAATTLLENVSDYTITRGGVVVARTMVTNSRGNLNALLDPVNAPNVVTMLDTNVLGLLALGAGEYVAYSKGADPTYPLGDIFVTKLDATHTTCPLTRRTNALRTLFFLPGGGGVSWAWVTNLDAIFSTSFNIRQAYTRLSDCKTTTVGDNIGSFGIAGDLGVLIDDGYDGSEGTLRFHPLTGGNTLAMGAPLFLQSRVNNFVPVVPSPGVILFAVATGSSADGLYMHLIEKSDASAVDAGAADVSTADAQTDTSR